jgi:hypothetical protein
MMRGPNVQADVTFLDCPAFLDKPGKPGTARCGLPAEVEYCYMLGSTDGPQDSAKIRCPAGHVFNGPLESLTLVGDEKTAALLAAARSA